MEDLDDFTRAYIECALWSSTDTIDGADVSLDDKYTVEDIAPTTLGKMIADCTYFQLEYSAALKRAYARSRQESWEYRFICR